MNAIAKKTGIVISAHDLRRGFATIAELVDVPLLTLKAIMNHAPTKDVTGKYIILTTERMREPVAKIGARITELCKIQLPKGENVRKMKARKAEMAFS